jgi:hypothetical protein
MPPDGPAEPARKLDGRGGAATRPGPRVLFMSGYAQPVLTTHDTLAAGVHLVEKPFSGAELVQALHEQPRQSSWPS